MYLIINTGKGKVVVSEPKEIGIYFGEGTATKAIDVRMEKGAGKPEQIFVTAPTTNAADNDVLVCGMELKRIKAMKTFMKHEHVEYAPSGKS